MNITDNLLVNNQNKLINAVIRSYYSTSKFEISHISKREFGFGINDKIEARHMCFDSILAFKKFMAEKRARYISYSAAHYKYPDKRPMEKKELIGIELTFDIDVNSPNIFLSEAELLYAKTHVIRLVEDFLLSDFGLSKQEILINFSGNRGYHVHVLCNDDSDNNFFLLGIDERRQIADYITGKNLSYDIFFDISSNRIVTAGPNIYQKGYYGRIAKEIVKQLQNTNLFKELRINSSASWLNQLQNALTTNNYKGVLIPNAHKKLETIFESVRSRVCISIDERVTYDATKLIRVPDTIHGSSGLIAKTISFGEIDKFDPYSNALVPVKGEVKLKSFVDMKTNINNNIYELKKNALITVPLKVAFVLCCKKIVAPILNN